MKESVRRVVLGPKRRTVAPPVRRDIEQFLASHGKTIELEGNRVRLVDGPIGRIPWERVLETDVAPLIQSLAHVSKRRFGEPQSS